ncbi:hypothetical protein ACFQ61_08080 [Streptomyces sp. NPDC056500]|uniref:hypothetical protein n=1 Tax=Streptomyces sp. NPDC056500 TaxID=3345840 RepID=UPI0036AE8A5F
MTEISLANFAQGAADLVLSRLDEKYELCFINQGECLTDEHIQRLLAGEAEVLDEHWEGENRWQGTNAVLDGLLSQDAQDWMGEHDVLIQVREAIEARDTSDPLSELMRQTGPKLFRYRLDGGAEADPWRFSDEKTEDAARALGTAAGLDFEENRGALRELVTHASYGGGLHVLWRGDIRKVYDAVCKVRWSDPASEITMRWTDPELLVLDTWNGSGHSVRVRGSMHFAFDPDRLSLDTTRGKGDYSWTDVVGAGYEPEGEAPHFIDNRKKEL